ncbi:hypothetical protein [Inquilinus sp.]|jgi:hypothetical protein|uniref:hypothetical protein n=1 Tax=Inquilinus sp. TaxID=1932117 RepID=UPI0037838572
MSMPYPDHVPVVAPAAVEFTRLSWGALALLVSLFAGGLVAAHLSGRAPRIVAAQLGISEDEARGRYEKALAEFDRLKDEAAAAAAGGGFATFATLLLAAAAASAGGAAGAGPRRRG